MNREQLHGVHVIAGSVELAAAAVAGGASVVQVRVKAGTDRQRFAAIESVVGCCRGTGTLCIVNDRADMALAAGAAGVHLGADDLPVGAVRNFVGSDFVVGGTVRNAASARRLVAEGASYLGAGPVWATTSKSGLPDPIGLDGLAEVAAAVEVPVIAISGVTAGRAPEALAAGASGVAVISAVASATDPVAATRQLVKIVEDRRRERPALETAP